MDMPSGPGPWGQGLTLVHFSAQLERFVWDRGARRDCVARIKGVLGGVKGVKGVFVSDTAQVELRSGRM
jgi:hypothetical protein